MWACAWQVAVSKKTDPDVEHDGPTQRQLAVQALNGSDGKRDSVSKAADPDVVHDGPTQRQLAMQALKQ